MPKGHVTPPPLGVRGMYIPQLCRPPLAVTTLKETFLYFSFFFTETLQEI